MIQCLERNADDLIWEERNPRVSTDIGDRVECHPNLGHDEVVAVASLAGGRGDRDVARLRSVRYRAVDLGIVPRRDRRGPVIVELHGAVNGPEVASLNGDLVLPNAARVGVDVSDHRVERHVVDRHRVVVDGPFLLVGVAALGVGRIDALRRASAGLADGTAVLDAQRTRLARYRGHLDSEVRVPS